MRIFQSFSNNGLLKLIFIIVFFFFLLQDEEEQIFEKRRGRGAILKPPMNSYRRTNRTHNRTVVSSDEESDVSEESAGNYKLRHKAKLDYKALLDGTVITTSEVSSRMISIQRKILFYCYICVLLILQSEDSDETFKKPSKSKQPVKKPASKPEKKKLNVKAIESAMNHEVCIEINSYIIILRNYNFYKIY